MAREANILPWNVLSETFDSAGSAPPNVADVYTDLDTTRLEQVAHEEELRAFMRHIEQTRRVPAQEMADREQHLLITGDPGSGKSTFVKHLAYLLASAAQRAEPAATLARLEPWSHGRMVPIYVELRNLAAFAVEKKHTQGTVRLFSQYLAHLLGQWGIPGAWEPLRRLLEGDQGPAILLLDGLDEVSTSQRKLLVEMVNALAADPHYARHRCIVTCRPYAYYDMPAEYRLRRFAEVTLEPFSAEQVDRFVANWYRRLSAGDTPHLTTAEAEAQRKDLAVALKRRDHRSLARRPILLTMMVQLRTYKGRLPDDRVDLYKASVDLLLTRWTTRSHDLPSLREFLGLGDLKDDEIEKALFDIAYHAHSAERPSLPGTDEDEDTSADIDEGELQAWVRPHLDGSDTLAARFVQYIRERAGLLIRHKTAAYTFPHRSLQEFLAACHLVRADTIDYKEAAPRLVAADPVRWREVFVLAAGYAARYARTSDAIAAVNGLCPRDCPGAGRGAALPAAQWDLAQVAAEALLEIGERRVERTTAGPAQWERAQGWLAALIRQEGTPDARTRAAAGRTLARLGDARAGVLAAPDMEFCYVPAGPFCMGSADDPNAYRNEQPATADFPMPEAYWMARYPVTVAQFQAFVDAGGYADPSFWPEAIEHGRWQEGRIHRFTAVKNKEDKWEARETQATAPADYGDPYRLPNHPVMGVSWYEALAYVRWLQQFVPAGWQAMLPNEPSWEKAARGGALVPVAPMVRPLSGLADGVSLLAMVENPTSWRRYPWGDEPDAGRMNYRETEIGTTSAVGCFAGGASPCGVEEMSGNVWEWTRSLWGSSSDKPDFGYPYDADDGREHLAAGPGVMRVLRGGAFYYYDNDVRCGVRLGDYPFGEDWDFGFRVVLSPCTSDR